MTGPSEPGRPAREPVGPGEESVWDYPRPPRLESTDRLVVVELGGRRIVECRRALRVLETSHPPTYYVNPYDIDLEIVELGGGRSQCEWKGQATYWNIRTETHVVERGAWLYPAPRSPYEALENHVAFYPAFFECFLDGERVRPQPGSFYGGWVTDEIKGPFKGAPGTMGW